MVEGSTPDPERWLPLKQRSSYKKKARHGSGGTSRKKDQHYLAGSSQGANDASSEITQHGGGSVGNLLKTYIFFDSLLTKGNISHPKENRLSINDDGDDGSDGEKASESKAPMTAKGSQQQKRKKKKNKR